MGDSDLISRGIAPKPPVRRLRPEVFAELESSMGGFRGGVGPEMEFRGRTAGGDCMWWHLPTEDPAHTLRLAAD